MAPITHIVLLEFKPEVTKAQRDEVRETKAMQRQTTNHLELRKLT